MPSHATDGTTKVHPDHMSVYISGLQGLHPLRLGIAYWYRGHYLYGLACTPVEPQPFSSKGKIVMSGTVTTAAPEFDPGDAMLVPEPVVDALRKAVLTHAAVEAVTDRCEVPSEEEKGAKKSGDEGVEGGKGLRGLVDAWAGDVYAAEQLQTIHGLEYHTPHDRSHFLAASAPGSRLVSRAVSPLPSPAQTPVDPQSGAIPIQLPPYNGTSHVSTRIVPPLGPHSPRLRILPSPISGLHPQNRNVSVPESLHMLRVPSLVRSHAPSPLNLSAQQRTVSVPTSLHALRGVSSRPVTPANPTGGEQFLGIPGLQHQRSQNGLRIFSQPGSRSPSPLSFDHGRHAAVHPRVARLAEEDDVFVLSGSGGGNGGNRGFNGEKQPEDFIGKDLLHSMDELDESSDDPFVSANPPKFVKLNPEDITILWGGVNHGRFANTSKVQHQDAQMLGMKSRIGSMATEKDKEKEKEKEREKLKESRAQGPPTDSRPQKELSRRERSKLAYEASKADPYLLHGRSLSHKSLAAIAHPPTNGPLPTAHSRPGSSHQIHNASLAPMPAPSNLAVPIPQHPLHLHSKPKSPALTHATFILNEVYNEKVTKCPLHDDCDGVTVTHPHLTEQTRQTRGFVDLYPTVTVGERTMVDWKTILDDVKREEREKRKREEGMGRKKWATLDVVGSGLEIMRMERGSARVREQKRKYF